MKSRLIKIFSPLVLLIVIYFLGPSPHKPLYNPSLPVIPAGATGLEEYILQKDGAHRIKPDNEARIVWADSTRRKTPYAVVYLHGFSASQKEGDPVHRRLAAEFGCNLYLSRLADHGVDTTDALQLMTADRLWNSAKEALVIGQQIGDKVILVSTSTGGTLALKLAATYPDKVHALINMSPNIAINNPAAFVLNDPWGLQIARMVMGGKYKETEAGKTNEMKARYWNEKYRIEAIVELESLVETSMTEEIFKKVTQPSLTMYYYKNEQEQDPEVKVSAILKMHEQLATADSLKVAKAVPGAGAHVLGCSLTSKDVETVYAEMRKFVADQLKLTPAASPYALLEK
jgi:pimeloyl-ACP methyl ester carboxylesterase